MPRESQPDTYDTLFNNLCQLYDDTLSRQNIKNEQMLNAYWQIGATICSLIGNPGRKVQYGQKIITRLSHDLTQKYGDGFKPRTVRYFRDFATQYPHTDLNPAISWSHYRILLSVSDKSTRARLEKRIVSEQLSKTDLETIVALARTRRSKNTGFPLAPRTASQGIFKIIDIHPDSRLVIVDLGFGVNRHLLIPGVNPSPGAYITQASTKKFKSISIQPGERYCYTGTLLNVIDGDTVKMRLDLHFDTSIDITLRLRGVDAMEINTKEGQQAKRALTDMLQKQTSLTVYTYSHDRYGRYIADLVTTDNTYINKQLIEKGHARFLKM